MKRIAYAAFLLYIILALTGCGLWRETPSDAGYTAQAAHATQTAPALEPRGARVLYYEIAPQHSTLVFENNADAVFTIYASRDGWDFSSVGSGFFVCSTGIAVTNHHVVTGWPYARARTHGGAEYDIIGYYSYDIYNDLAIIQVDGRNFAYLLIGNSDELQVGERVYAIGSPLGFHNTFSGGMFARTHDVLEFGIYRVYDMLQHTAPVSEGSSGGALLNNLGQVIGVTTAWFDMYAQSLNFAVPISRVCFAYAAAEYLPLPIGEITVVAEDDVIGTWIWSHGYYNFNANGTGSRMWGAVPDSFTWGISDRNLDLTLADGSEERWTVSSGSDENSIIVGGTWFTRVKARPYTLGQILSASDLAGKWHWDWGYYVFYTDGTGHRQWGETSDVFKWDLEDNHLALLFPDQYDEEWVVSAINNNKIAMGGAFFTRGEPLASAIIGYWRWSGGSYAFNPDGSGSRTWDGVFAEFEWVPMYDRIMLYLQGGVEESWRVSVVGDNEIIVEGVLFTRGG